MGVPALLKPMRRLKNGTTLALLLGPIAKIPMFSSPFSVPAREILKLLYRTGIGAQFASSLIRRTRRETFRPHSCVGEFENRSVVKGMTSSAIQPSLFLVVLISHTPSQSLFEL